MNWYINFKLAQQEDLFGQEQPNMSSKPLFDINNIPNQIPHGKYSGDLEQDIVKYVHNEQELYSVLNEIGAEHNKVEFDSGHNPIVVINYNGSDYVVDSFDQPSVVPAEEWLSNVDIFAYYPHFDFNKEFWNEVHQGEKVYHGTTKENVSKIMKQGILPTNETRGLSNRHTGPAVFTSMNPDSTGYYAVTIEIAVDAMKADGYMPKASKEDAIQEADLYESLARKIGLEEYFHEVSDSSLDPETVIFYGAIPPKYLKVIE